LQYIWDQKRAKVESVDWKWRNSSLA